MAIFAHCDNETGRCCAWYVHQQWTGATQIEVELIEIVEPVGGRPKIAGISTKDWARLKANYCFTTVPGPSGIESVTGGNERIVAVTGDTTDAPDRAAVRAGAGARSPCCHAGWVAYRHAHQPAMIKVALPHAAIADVMHVINVKRLSINVTDDRAVKAQVACQVASGALRKGRIDVKAITRTVVVILSNIDLSVCGNNCGG